MAPLQCPSPVECLRPAHGKRDEDNVSVRPSFRPSGSVSSQLAGRSTGRPRPLAASLRHPARARLRLFATMNITHEVSASRDEQVSFARARAHSTPGNPLATKETRRTNELPALDLLANLRLASIASSPMRFQFDFTNSPSLALSTARSASASCAPIG